MLERVTATWRFFRDPQASLGMKLLFLGALLYVLFPADLIPDVIPVLGWLDDLGLATLAATILWSVTGPYARGERGHASQHPGPTLVPARAEAPVSSGPGGYPRARSWGHQKGGVAWRSIDTDGVDLG